MKKTAVANLWDLPSYSFFPILICTLVYTTAYFSTTTTMTSSIHVARDGVQVVYKAQASGLLLPYSYYTGLSGISLHHCIGFQAVHPPATLIEHTRTAIGHLLG